jgi:cytochrome c oxidase assembly factor CtaG
VAQAHAVASWDPAPAVLAGVGLALILFVQAFARLRRRGRADHAPWSRALLFALGLVVLALPLVSPLDGIGEEDLLSGHMLQHMLVGDAAPALLLVALRGPLVFFLLPGAVLAFLARLRPLREALAFLLRPRVSFAVWAAAFAAWHVPAAYDFVHATFFVAGLLVWSQLVDPARRGALTVPGRVAFAVGLFASGLVLSDILIFSFDPLYEAYASQNDLLGISPLTDQRLAGLAMMLEQTVTLGVCVAVLLRAHLRRAALA